MTHAQERETSMRPKRQSFFWQWQAPTQIRKNHRSHLHIAQPQRFSGSAILVLVLFVSHGPWCALSVPWSVPWVCVCPRSMERKSLSRGLRPQKYHKEKACSYKPKALEKTPPRPAALDPSLTLLWRPGASLSVTKTIFKRSTQKQREMALSLSVDPA